MNWRFIQVGEMATHTKGSVNLGSDFPFGSILETTRTFWNLGDIYTLDQNMFNDNTLRQSHYVVPNKLQQTIMSDDL